MSSVEGNESIEESFNKILREEYKQDWELITIPPKLVALFCYCIPALIMLGSADYHNQNVLATLFFSLVIGTGFYGYYRNHQVLKAFLSNEKPLRQVIRDIREQGSLDSTVTYSDDASKLTEAEESDWGTIVTQLEKSMEMDEEDSDTMNLSTLFDRSESEQATISQPRRTSWFKRLFGRN